MVIVIKLELLFQVFLPLYGTVEEELLLESILVEYLIIAKKPCGGGSPVIKGVEGIKPTVGCNILHGCSVPVTPALVQIPTNLLSCAEANSKEQAKKAKVSKKLFFISAYA